MPFEVKKLLEHGADEPDRRKAEFPDSGNPEAVQRSEGHSGLVGDLYVNSLLKKLLRCWEIKERFKEEFAAAIGQYKPPSAANAPVKVPQIARLEEECHNSL